MGNYRSALHDVAKLELDLSKNLVEWEAARLLQSRREEEGLVEERERTLRIAREKRDREEQRRVEKEVRMAQGIVEDVEMDESDDEPKTKSKNEEESDDEVPPCAPLTAYDLARVSRWPLVPSVLLEDEFTLGEELLALLESKSEVINSRNANNGAVEPPRKRSTRAPSAYAPDGPLATTEDLSSQSDSDDSINSDDSFSLTPNVSRIVVTLASTLDSLLQSMAQETTPCYFPPTDYWEAKMVKDAWRTKPPRKGLDFNDVMRIVEDMAVVPQAVKDLLSEQLHDLYGSDGTSPALLPRLDSVLIRCCSSSGSARLSSRISAGNKRLANDFDDEIVDGRGGATPRASSDRNDGEDVAEEEAVAGIVVFLAVVIH